MLAEGTFREDLYYRLNVIPVRTLPLRERKEDIALLATHFLLMYNKELDRQVEGFSPDALNILDSYPWPGNIRELRNVLERAVALSSSDQIKVGDLPEHMRDAHEPTVVAGTAVLSERGLDLEENTAKIERAIIKQALEFADGSRKSAAELLGLTPRSLRYRLQKYGLTDKE